MTTETTTVEAQARAALDALIATHGLPAPKWVRWLPNSPALSVRVEILADLRAYAGLIPAPIEEEHYIGEAATDPRRWWVSWTRRIRAADWLPGVALRVWHAESRYADPPNRLAAAAPPVAGVDLAPIGTRHPQGGAS